MAALFARDLRLAVKVGGGAPMGVLFFLVVVALMPFSIGPDLPLLARIGPAVLWIGALLATLLGLDRMFQADRDDGSLDVLLAGDQPLELVVLVKGLAHWVATSLPLVVAAPFMGLLLNMSGLAIGAVTATLLVGTPSLTLIGMIGAALTVSLRRGGVLIAILVLPLTVPTLVFGVGAVLGAVTDPAPFLSPFLVLCALTLVAFVVGPIAAAAALRQSQG
ncbi:heme exporter protein CcmB [Amorphus sp. 3PC139-8]|uniref:heme exporter protein CcmB n=1 Tax=Amorphus sp. 3PC139-8 TaxID=2735676 RepID=UPI00345D0D03